MLPDPSTADVKVRYSPEKTHCPLIGVHISLSYLTHLIGTGEVFVGYEEDSVSCYAYGLGFVIQGLEGGLPAKPHQSHNQTVNASNIRRGRGE